MAKQKTHEEFEREVMELGGGEYICLSNYKNWKTHVKMKHIICGHEYDVKPSKFKEGRRCPHCSRIKKAKKEDEFKSEVEQIGKGEYELLSPYINHKEYVKMRHVVCGHEYKVRPTNFLQRNRCPKCYANPMKTHEEFLKDVLHLGFGRYKLLSNYESSKDHVKMKHLDCGHEYKVRPLKFIAGNRCPSCTSSKGELLIESVLKESGLSFKKEFSFPECKNMRPLRFDFCVHSIEEDVLLLIEFDGIQHYKEIKHFGGRKDFLRRVKNDRIKSNFAKNAGIPLLRIRYDQENPEQLLLKVIEHVHNGRNLKSNRAS